MAILTALLLFCHVVAGFRNRGLVELVGSLLDQPYTARQATCDLRRLRRKGLIVRLPHSQRYQLTSLGSDRPRRGRWHRLNSPPSTCTRTPLLRWCRGPRQAFELP